MEHQLPQRISNFINGVFVDPVGVEYLASFLPATGLKGPEIPRSSKADVDLAVSAAQESFDTIWSSITPIQRSVMMIKIADLIQEELEEFATLESLDNGKPLWLSKSVDIPRAIHNFRFFASAILHSKEECTSTDISLNYVHKSAAGVAALISPWNLPLYLLTWKIAPAMACEIIPSFSYFDCNNHMCSKTAARPFANPRNSRL
jgi:aminomuconate-semialdehyde/2-hydroxymuconate-6-semialdehyde dehydrogenase